MVVAGYFRVSKARDGMQSPDIYRDEIERYCDFKRLRLAEVFADLDFSAWRGARPRPALEQLVERRHEFGAIIIPKLSRFGRSVSDLVRLFNLFDRDGVDLVFLDMGIDTSTSQGRLLRNIMASFAEFESDVKSDYIRAAYRHLQMQGRAWGGRPPFGYDRDPATKGYTVNVELAPTVREIFSRYLEGQTQYEIAKSLNEQGRTRPFGGVWRTQQIGRVIDNPAYVALCILDGERFPANWEPIIDLETWEKVHELRKHTIAIHHGRKLAGPRTHLLSGLIHCGVCGRKLHFHAARSRSSYYKCPKSHHEYHTQSCPGGSIAAYRAEEMVTTAFLARVRFSYADSPADARVHLAKPEAAWDKASMGDRKRLLALAIERVVVVPWPEGDTRRFGNKGRDIEIEWADRPSLKDVPPPLDLIVPSGPPKESARRVKESRAATFREHRAQADDDSLKARGDRASSYHREWKAFRSRNMSP
jgi:site-specific DNA recombinase